MKKTSGRVLSDRQATEVAKKAGSHVRSIRSASQKGISVRTGSIEIADDKITISESRSDSESSQE